MDAQTISSSGLAERNQPKVWTVALAGLAALLVGVGLSRFGYPPLIPALVGAGWFTTAQADYLGATNLAGYLLGAALARRLTGWLSEPTLIRSAMVIATASFAACAFPLGFAWYFVWRLLSGVIGGVLMVCAALAILAVTPPERRGRVGGVVFTGVGLGIALSGTLVPWLVGFGLPSTWLCFAVVSGVLTAVAWIGLPRPAARQVVPSKKGSRGARLTPAVLLLMIAYSCNAIGFVPHTVFWVDFIARGLGRGLAVGSAYWVLMGVAAAAGPLLLGLLADRVGFGISLRASLFAKAFGVALPLFSTQPWALALSAVGVGSLAIGVTSLASGRVGDLVAPEHRAQVWGWMTMVFSIVYAGTAYVLSYLFAQTGSYRLLFVIAAVALLVGCVLDLVSSRQTVRQA